MVKWDLFQVRKYNLISANQCDAAHYKMKGSKSYDHIDIKSIQYYSSLTESAFSFPFPIPNTNQSCYSFEIKPKWGSLPK